MLPPHDHQQPIGQRRHQRAEELGEGFCRFRELIGKLGSGERTSTGLTQAEAREAIERWEAGIPGRPESGTSPAADVVHDIYATREGRTERLTELASARTGSARTGSARTGDGEPRP